jgi:hypothetical protein
MIAEKVQKAILMLQAFTAQKCEDGELTDTEIEQMIGELEAIINALQFTMEQRQEALQAAATQGREARTEI